MPLLVGWRGSCNNFGAAFKGLEIDRHPCIEGRVALAES